MFKKLREYFQNDITTLDVDKSGNPTPKDLQVATVVMLVEMASADNDIAEEEAEQICLSVAAHFGVDQDEVPELVQIAISSRQESNKIDDFVSTINDNFNETQRLQILAMVWRVVLADGKVDKFEERFLVQLKTRFKLSSESLEEARKIAAAE